MDGGATEGMTSLERMIYVYVKSKGPDGISSGELKKHLGAQHPGREISAALRTLMQSHKVDVTKADGTADVIISVKESRAVSNNFTVVLQAVRQAGEKGIDQQSIATKSKIMRGEVSKALAYYVQNKQIKETRSFTTPSQKIYILAEFEPSASVTGGVFYTTERVLNIQLIDAVRAAIVETTQQRGTCSVGTMHEKLSVDPTVATRLGGGRRLSVDEVATVAQALELDGVLLPVARRGAHVGSGDEVGDRLYRCCNRRPLGATAPWVSHFPCTGCPLLGVCQSRGNADGVANVAGCVYMEDWLLLPEAKAARTEAAATAAAAGAGGSPPTKVPLAAPTRSA